MSLGRNLQFLRKMHDGMTQEELAEKSGVSRGTISALENGIDRTTTSKTLVKLAQALDTTVDRIFFTKGV